MRYLVLSDLHGNLEAFDACLKLAEGNYDRIVCLGDIVGYGPDPAAVLDEIRRQTSEIIRGNHDKACSGAADIEDFNPWAKAAAYWTRDSLSEEQLAYLRELPPGPMNVANFAMVHGSALDEDQYVISATEALPLLEMQPWAIVFFGHTHIQGGFSVNSSGKLELVAPDSRSPTSDRCVMSIKIESSSRYLLNPGSVGQPRDGNWRAAFAILDDARGVVEYYRVAYDLPATQRKMSLAGLPEPLIRRLVVGR